MTFLCNPIADCLDYSVLPDVSDSLTNTKIPKQYQMHHQIMLDGYPIINILLLVSQIMK